MPVTLHIVRTIDEQPSAHSTHEYTNWVFAAKAAHLIARQDSRDPMGDKEDIPFNSCGSYVVAAYWGTTSLHLEWTLPCGW